MTNDPLGLTKGSVRSILALLLTLTVCAMGLAALGYGLTSGRIQDPTAIVMAVVALGQMAVGAYFVTRSTPAA